MLTLPAFTGESPPITFDLMPHAPIASGSGSGSGSSSGSSSGSGSDSGSDSRSDSGSGFPPYFTGNTPTSLIRTFACKTCWNPIYFKSTSPADLWNLFVTHISGGLLTGREVPRPRGAAERARRSRAYSISK